MHEKDEYCPVLASRIVARLNDLEFKMDRIDKGVTTYIWSNVLIMFVVSVILVTLPWQLERVDSSLEQIKHQVSQNAKEANEETPDQP